MLASLKMKTDNLDIIKQGTIIVLSVLALISILITILIHAEEKTLLFVLVGVLAAGLFIYFIYFIPQAQRLEITKYGILFYSYRQCRTYHWSHIKAVELREFEEKNVKREKVVVKMFHSGANRTSPEHYFEKTINAEIYGYQPAELFEIIRKNTSQQRKKRK